MNHEVRDLLESASTDVAAVDLAERAWAGAANGRRRSRRRAPGIAAVAVVAVSVGSYEIGNRVSPAPTSPAPSIIQSVTTGAWKTFTDGTKYVVAPPLGTE